MIKKEIIVFSLLANQEEKTGKRNATVSAKINSFLIINRGHRLQAAQHF